MLLFCQSSKKPDINLTPSLVSCTNNTEGQRPVGSTCHHLGLASGHDSAPSDGARTEAKWPQWSQAVDGHYERVSRNKSQGASHLSASLFKCIQWTSDRGGSSFISSSHPPPRAACRALMPCRNIITALMWLTLKLSSYDLIPPVLQ